MVVFGVVGLVGNLVSMAILAQGLSNNVNMRAALLEVLNDALGSVAVLVGALVIALTGWLQADAVVSLLIAVLIVPRTLKLLRETVSVLLESTPPGLDLDDVRRHLLTLPRVIDIHDLHASQITSGLPVLSAHVVVEDTCFQDGHAPQILDQLQTCIAEHFPVSIEPSTFQLEAPAQVRPGVTRSRAVPGRCGLRPRTPRRRPVAGWGFERGRRRARWWRRRPAARRSPGGERPGDARNREPEG
jgi:cobalt-zinc-cadmium efflux system protein